MIANVPVGQIVIRSRADRPAWLLLVERIEGGLRQRYQPEELPPAWLTLLGRLDTKPEAQDRDY